MLVSYYYVCKIILIFCVHIWNIIVFLMLYLLVHRWYCLLYIYSCYILYDVVFIQIYNMSTLSPITQMHETFEISKCSFHSVISPSIFNAFVKTFKLQLIKIV